MASPYLDPYLPTVLQKTLHPLESSVTHKQRQQDRLLITVTTREGTILATFQQQVQEIDLLLEERDPVTLNARAYEPFVNDTMVIRVTKHTDMTPALAASSNPPIQFGPVQEPGLRLDPPGSIP